MPPWQQSSGMTLAWVEALEMGRLSDLTRRRHEEPGGARKSQEEPGGARRSQEESRRAKRR